MGSHKQLVLIGGGHTHALVLHHLRSNPIADVAITVINPGRKSAYSGMLPGFVAGHYAREDLDIDLSRLVSSRELSLIDDRACSIDPDKRTIGLASGDCLRYDIASLDVGVTSAMPGLEGFAEHAVPAKPLGEFASRWQEYLASTTRSTIAVIGGGLAGAELAMAMAYATQVQNKSGHVRLLDRNKVLTTLGTRARRKAIEALKQFRIEIIEDVTVAHVSKRGVTLEDGTFIEATFVVGAAGATPREWIQRTGLKRHRGFIEVDDYLRSEDLNVFAVGDCAHFRSKPCPKAGVYAVRQAPVLLENLKRSLTGQPLRNYVPQSDYLKLMSLGSKQAIGEKFGVTMSGRLVWSLKDWIDRKFMEQFV